MIGVHLAKIHGNWCGPNWTGGKNVSAQDYKGSWNAPCSTKLDCACRAHDKDCSHPKGCSKAGDTRLIEAANKRILPFFNKVKLEAEFASLLLRGKGESKRAKSIRSRIDESDDADLLVSGISIARLFRRR